jgi:uncharacterized membrane protein
MLLHHRLLLACLIALSVMIAGYAFIFQAGLTGDSAFQARFAQIPLFAAFHVLGSGVALLLGGFQFLPGLRARRLNLHRWLGRTYLLAVLIGGIGGLMLATQAEGGLVSRTGFGLLGALWLTSGWRAYAAIRRKDIASHRLWMIRNFALTFAAVTLRAYLGIMTGFLEMDFAVAYPAIAWLCWVPNLIVAEWVILRRLAVFDPEAASTAG